jgi:hypothetical protein
MEMQKACAQVSTVLDSKIADLESIIVKAIQ